MARPRRNIIVTLTADEWDRLLQDAIAAERDPWQQARWIVRQALSGEPAAPAAEPESEAVA